MIEEVRMRASASDTGPPNERPVVRVGYLPLTDCAPIIVAAARGFDRKHGIVIQALRQPSWAAVRDKLLVGALDAAHLLYGLVYGIELGIAGPRRPMAALMTLNRNGQAITLSTALRKQGVRSGEDLARYLRSGAPLPHFAHTFPTGTHALWLYYWLAAHGIDPLRDVHTSTVPPPLMVEHMSQGRIDGYSAGEPWPAHAIDAGVGHTVVTSQEIWPDHPEKTLACTREFVQRSPDTARALVMAVLEACRYLELAAHRDEAAALLARPECLDMPAALIAARLGGRYSNGLGRDWHDDHACRFFDGGAVNFPYLSDGMWFLTQFRRWGLLSYDPDYLRCATGVNQIALYREAASALGVALPDTVLRSAQLIDGKIWNGDDPERYAHSFALAHHADRFAPA